MANEDIIVNKIIPVETIIEVAKYLENQKEEYRNLFDRDKVKNNDLRYNEQIYEYKGDIPKVQYTIKFKDGKEVTELNHNWFLGMLENIKFIDEITLYSNINYSSNILNRTHYEYKSLFIWVHFRQDSVSIRVDGKGMEEQTYKVHSQIINIIENNEERCNKTVKNRSIRIQSLCLSIGFVLSYILYLIFLLNKSNLPTTMLKFFDNKYILIIGQWFVAAFLGNIFGLPIMMSLYRNILPKTKFSHYSRSSHQSVYVDNIKDYTSHNEVQIGDFANNGKNRIIIEKIYKITRIVVLLQLIISIILLFIIK